MSHRAALLAGAVMLLSGAPAHAASQEKQAYAAGLAAYVYGYPPLLSQGTADKLPAQTLISVAALTGPEQRVIVLPNVDTPYTVANLDLAAEPLVLHVPAIPKSRYYVFELLDAYTNVIGYVGTRTTGTAAGDYLLAGPGWSGSAPSGIAKVLRSPTNRIVIVGRTLALGADDLPNVKAIQEQYGLQPLSAFAAGTATSHGLILDKSNGLTHPALPEGLAFLDALGALLAEQRAPARDAKLLARLKPFGVGPGLTPSAEPLSAAVKRGLTRGVAAGPARVQRIADALNAHARDGWVLKTDGIGAYGTDYDLRAATALVGLWANTADEAYYPMASLDARGRRLDGRRRYVLRFARGQLPPAGAFWSLTMYDRDYFLYANPLGRYAIGDRTTGLRRGKDGSLTIYLQHSDPGGSRTANWLPAPASPFTVTLRLYAPTRRALSGAWTPPGIVRAG